MEVVAAREETARATWAEPGTHKPNLTRSATQGLKKWNFFLSHTQRNGDAKSLALELFFGFKDLDKKIWLDVKMPKMDMEAMKDGVNGSRCVIAIITGGDETESRYFQRPMCVEELKWAIEAGVKIVPVVTAADKPKVGEYIAEGIAAGIDLSACDFQHVDRSNPNMMEASLKSIIGAEAIAEAGKTVNVHLHCIGTVSAVLSITCACTCTRTCIHAHMQVMSPAVTGKAKVVGKLASAGSSVEGLAVLLASLKLTEHLAAADAWCVEQGAEDVADLKDEDLAEQLVEALKLKRIPAKKLVAAIRG